jgi:hypothetical protein
MTSRDFVFWLQGFFEISKETSLSEDQIKVVKNHLAMVFKHDIDPTMGGLDTQAALTHLHQGGSIETILKC